MSNMYCVYKFTSDTTGLSYIGMTKNLESRKKHHKKPSSTNLAFSEAIKLYGWNDFKHEVIASGLNYLEACELEAASIAECNTIHPNGYNLATGGKHSKPSEETKAKISQSQIGNKKCLGRQLSPETRLKMSLAKLGNKNRAKDGGGGGIEAASTNTHNQDLHAYSDLVI